VSVLGGALARFITLTQTDVKSLVAYSRVVHMALVTFRVLLSSPSRNPAGLIMMVGHGVCRSGLFYLATLQYERLRTRSLLISQGLMQLLPSLTLLWGLLILMNIRCPPSLTLLSEVLIIGSLVSVHIITVVPVRAIVLLVLVYRVHLFYSYSHSNLNCL
jgi:NADH:ubiquinone oxidoreductase subunit 4 (subunit M)